MSDADDAYKEAQRLIAEALTNNDHKLDLNTKETHALTTLPPEIADLTKITALSFSNTQISDSDLTHIAGLQRLHVLSLNNTQISDDGMKYMSELRAIQELSLNDSRITDSGLRYIAGLRRLERLSINDTQVGDKGLKYVAGLRMIQELSLNNSKVTDDGLKYITGLRALRVLSLNNTQISDNGMKYMSKLRAIQELSLSNSRVTDSGLKYIAELRGLRRLELYNTQFSDRGFEHLNNMQALQYLNIGNTQVKDLRPILELSSVNNGYGVYNLRHLFFQNIPAVSQDQKLRTLSENPNTEFATAQTFAYLHEVWDDWSPLPVTAPDQDTILTVSQTGDGRLDISPATPDAEEITDTVKQKAHQLLQQATKSLEQTAGNMHPRLASSARTLSLHIDCPLDQVDMLDVHFELEALRGTYERRGERKGEDIFGDDVIDALDKVLMIGPGLVLDNEEVEKLEARRDRYRGAPPNPDVQAAQDQLSDSIALDPTLFGDTIRSYSVTFKDGHAEDSERFQAGQGTLNRNAVIKVGSHVANKMVDGVLGGGAFALSAWLVLNYETIIVLAPTWGTAFEAWITPIMMRAREAELAARALLKRPN